jgi:ABC-type amino acid transport substrate-binding protein
MLEFGPYFSRRRLDLRTAKYTILMMVSLMLIAMGCSSKKEGEVKSAEESMRKNKKVIIIVDPVNAPFEYGADAGVQGLGVDIGTEIAKDLNIEVKWITLQSIEAAQANPKVKGYEHLLDILKKGDAEIIVSSAWIDPKKEIDFAFSTPYYETGDGIALQRGASDMDVSKLSGKKVGVCSGRFGDNFMSTQKEAANVAVTRFRSMDDALGALNRTELDAVVGDEPILAYSIVKSYTSTTLVPKQVNKYQYAAVVRKGETELLQKINNTINRLKTSGELQKMKDKWVGDIIEKAVALHQGDIKTKQLEQSPKNISVGITKVSGAWKMDMLDGFQLRLQGPKGTFQSTGIYTDGNHGTCKINQVPPGEYSLQMPISRTPQKLQIPELAKTSLQMEMTIVGSNITITIK